MRNLLVAASALSLLVGGAAFAQSGQGGAIGSNPSNVQVSPPAQGTGGPGNTTYTYPGTSTSAGGSGVGVSSGQGTVDPAQPGNYGVPGKVGGTERH
jgi:hypothetical protein